MTLWERLSRMFRRGPAAPSYGPQDPVLVLPANINVQPPVMTAPPRRVFVTAQLLTDLGWSYPAQWAAVLPEAMEAHKINTLNRVVDALAQFGHESGRGRFREEIWGPTPTQLRYEGRMSLGNSQPGDGKLFRGRGLIQLTGRTNYEVAKFHLKPDLSMEVFIKWVQTFEGAARVSCWWWEQNGCNRLSDSGDFEALTRRINGGLNGLEDRKAQRDAAMRALKV